MKPARIVAQILGSLVALAGLFVLFSGIDVDPGTRPWVIDALDTEIRIRASNIDGSPVFVGVASEAAVILLITGTYPEGLFRLVIGLNRWLYRVVAHVALMTDRYRRFRLDQGGPEPVPRPAPPPRPAPIYDDEPIDLTNHRPTDAERVAPGHGWSPYA